MKKENWLKRIYKLRKKGKKHTSQIIKTLNKNKDKIK